MRTEVTHMAYPVCEAVVIALMETGVAHMACQAAELRMAVMGLEATLKAYSASGVLWVAQMGTEAPHMACSACEAVEMAHGVMSLRSCWIAHVWSKATHVA